MNLENDQQEQTKKRKKWLLLFLLLFILSVGIGFGIRRIFFEKTKEKVTVISGDFLPNGKDAKKMSDQEIEKYAQKKVDDSKFNMMIGSTATIDSKTQQGTLNIKNPQTNIYPINVVVTEDKTGDILYSSGAIAPGEEVSSIQLEKIMAKGSYPATARFSLYDPKTKAKKGEVAAGVIIFVN